MIDMGGGLPLKRSDWRDLPVLPDAASWDGRCGCRRRCHGFDVRRAMCRDQKRARGVGQVVGDRGGGRMIRFVCGEANKENVCQKKIKDALHTRFDSSVLVAIRIFSRWAWA